MSYLVIDTSTENTLIAVDQIIYSHPVDHGYSDTISHLLSGLEYLTQSSKKSAIKTVMVGCGPGSYTGLRIGLATAKMWAYAKKHSLFGFNSLLVFAPSSDQMHLIGLRVKKDIAVVFDARGAGLYVMKGRVDIEKKELIWASTELVSWSSVPKFSKSIGTIYHPISQKIEQRWNEAGGDRVEWIAQKPDTKEIFRVIDQNGQWGSWERQYQEIELTYNNSIASNLPD